MLTKNNPVQLRSYHITEDMIHELTDEERVARGWAYFLDGRVISVAFIGQSIYAKVKGTRLYSVTIEFKHNLNLPDTYCTCPFEWGVCKHIVATLYAVIGQQDKELPVIKTSRELIKTEIAKTVTTPVEKKTGSKRQRWTKKIENLLLQEPLPVVLPSAQAVWNLIYVINITSHTTELQACRRKIKKDGLPGEVTKIINYDLNDSEHFDSVDRLILPNVATPQGLVLWNYATYNNISSRIYRPTSIQLFSTILEHLEDKEVYVSDFQYQMLERIQIVAKPVELSFVLEEKEDSDTLVAMVQSEGEMFPLQSPVRIIMKDPLWVLNKTKLFKVTNADQKTIEQLKKSSWKVEIPKETKETFRKATLPRILERYSVKSDSIQIQSLADGFSKRLYLQESLSQLQVTLKYAYSNYEVPEKTRNHHFIVLGNAENTYYSIERNLQAESDSRRDLIDSYMSEIAPNCFFPRQHPLDWITQKLPLLVEKGFEVYGKENLKSFKIRSSPSLDVSISSGIDWFDISMNVNYEGVVASFKDIYNSVQKEEQFVKLSDGTLGLIPEEWMKKFKRAFSLTNANSSEWKLSRAHFSLIDQLFQEQEIHSTDNGFNAYKKKFDGFTSISSSIIPSNFVGELRPYQKSGYDWLQFLKEFQFNGCLADDMGLGKTIQTLALLQHEYGNGAKHPSIIVVPTSIIFNWLNEAQRFTPSLSMLCQTGIKRIRSIDELNKYDIIVTSYGTLRRDIQLLNDMHFHYVILDESQNIKNSLSQNAKAVKLLKSEHRLTLTGTPVENNLLELWSQFDFLNPGLLGSRNSFHDNFVRPIERNKDEDAVDMLKKTIYPFILRRTKEVVAKDLPPKTETVKYCEMERSQRTMYNHWRDYYRAAIFNSIASVGLQNSKLKVLEGLMKLRQICCHPHLIDSAYSDSSGKFEVWKEMVEELLAENHKALIFSQFVKMLRVLSEHCDTLQIDYEYLDGSTRDREERVGRFQGNDEVRLFLISLKAGGVGLNLTAADYVIHYDPWWNPAVEMQATDRTHRIGQTKNIFSYKLITKDTIEEKILLLQEKKKVLVQSIITAETGIMKQITKEDIEMLFE